MLQNIQAMYKNTEYLVKYKNGHLDPIFSYVGLKQGCPLSPMLFNLYIDDVINIFDDKCEPITFQGKEISHFLYADDLVILSSSENGLQTGLDKLQAFSVKKHLTISIDKSKTIIFNKTGKLIRRVFKIDGKDLEPVQTFCYLGYEINASGTSNTAINNLYDKASKAMQPLLRTVSRFNIPIETSIRLFDAYISPIMLYNVENWGEMTTKRIQNFANRNFWSDIIEAKASNIHRKFLKYTMGVTKSCPNLAVMGDTGEIPLMMKGYRLMVQYWNRVTNLPNESLAKKSLFENIELKTNWIATIEKLINYFNLSESFQNPSKLRYDAKKGMHTSFVEFWKNNIKTNGRLEFYCKHKNVFKFEEYLHLPSFDKRKAITKLRCSDHELEIEKGRHKNIPREARCCKFCNKNEIETEKHSLFECNYYDDIRTEINFNNVNETLFSFDNVSHLGQYIMLALAKRKNKDLIDN